MTTHGQIVVRGVTKSYRVPGGALTALSLIDLAIPGGEFVAVLGPSGCGKSTLLRIIAGLVSPSSGSVTIDGVDPREAQRRKALGVVFQDPSLLPWRSVRDNVALPLEVNRRRQAPAVEPLLELVGLAAFRDYLPHQLSGGMQQRVAIARALAVGPAVLLMDEPFGALDAITRDSLRDDLQRLWLTRRPTVIFVTHSISEAVYLADRVVVLTGRPGSVAADAPIALPRPRTPDTEDSAPFLATVAQLRRQLRAAA